MPAGPPDWIGGGRQNRWGWELSVGGTIGLAGAGGIGSSATMSGTWLVGGGLVGIGLRQAHAFRRGIATAPPLRPP